MTLSFLDSAKQYFLDNPEKSNYHIDPKDIHLYSHMSWCSDAFVDRNYTLHIGQWEPYTHLTPIDPNTAIKDEILNQFNTIIMYVDGNNTDYIIYGRDTKNTFWCHCIDGPAVVAMNNNLQIFMLWGDIYTSLEWQKQHNLTNEELTFLRLKYTNWM